MIGFNGASAGGHCESFRTRAIARADRCCDDDNNADAMDVTCSVASQRAKKAAGCVCGRSPAATSASCSQPRTAPHAAHLRALSEERVQFNAAGQVELELETPGRDGATHLVVSAGVHAASGGTGAATDVAPDSVPRCADAQRQAAGAGYAAGASKAGPSRETGD